MTGKSCREDALSPDSFSTTTAMGITRRCMVESRTVCSEGKRKLPWFFPSPLFSIRVELPPAGYASTPAFILTLQTAIFFLCIPHCKTEVVFEPYFSTTSAVQISQDESAHAIAPPLDGFYTVIIAYFVGYGKYRTIKSAMNSLEARVHKNMS